MKLVKFDHESFSPASYQKAQDLVNGIRENLIKYCSSEEEYEKKAYPLPVRLAMLFEVLPDGFDSKKILDLGCGSKDNYDCLIRKGSYEPWLCRVLYELKLNPVGIDINHEVKQEKFEAHCIDLMAENSLGFLPDSSIDIAYSCRFFDSPYLIKLDE